MVCKCDMRTKLVGDGCSECNPEMYKEMLMDDKPTYDELVIAVRGYEEECKALKAHVNRLREALADIVSVSQDDIDRWGKLETLSKCIGRADEALEEVPQASLNHITEQPSCSEQALLELKAWVEEETVLLFGEVLKRIGFTGIDEFIANYPYKYSNQPETAAKDGE